MDYLCVCVCVLWGGGGGGRECSPPLKLLGERGVVPCSSSLLTPMSTKLEVYDRSVCEGFSNSASLTSNAPVICNPGHPRAGE